MTYTWNRVKNLIRLLRYLAIQRFRSNRQRWLLQHFGREGARRWLDNDQRKREFIRLEQAKAALSLPTRNSLLRLCRLVAYQFTYSACQLRLQANPEAYQTVHLGQDGKVHGLAMQRLGTKDRTTDPPWGCGGRPYSIAHHPNPRCRKAIDGRHGEPAGEDWLAAGFWQKGLEAAFQDALGSRNGIDLFDDEGAFDRAAIEERNLKARLRPLKKA